LRYGYCYGIVQPIDTPPQYSSANNGKGNDMDDFGNDIGNFSDAWAAFVVDGLRWDCYLVDQFFPAA
jgi:hypothetical protein